MGFGGSKLTSPGSPLDLSALQMSKSGDQQSIRFNSFVDRQIAQQIDQGEPMLVMSRRDALRAVQDETLTKSEERGRLARCGMDMGHHAAKHMQHLRENAHDWVDYAHQRYVQTPPFVPGYDHDAILEASVHSSLSARSGSSNKSNGRSSLNGNKRFDSGHGYAPSRTLSH